MCLNRCGEACHQILYRIESIIGNEQNNLAFKFQIKEDDYMNFKFSPQIDFIQLIISITNILSLWHGMHFFGFLLKLVPIIGNIMSKIKILFKFKSSRHRNNRYYRLIANYGISYKVIIK